MAQEHLTFEEARGRIYAYLDAHQDAQDGDISLAPRASILNGPAEMPGTASDTISVQTESLTPLKLRHVGGFLTCSSSELRFIVSRIAS